MKQAITTLAAMVSMLLIAFTCRIPVEAARQETVAEQGIEIVEVEVEEPIEPIATVEEVTQEIVSMEEPTEVETKVDMFTQVTPLDYDLERYIKSIAIEYQLEPALVFAVIEVESNFNVDIVGDSNASVGLMQIQPKYWQGLANEIGVNLYTPQGNVITGCAILNILSQKYDGDIVKVLKAYNSGNPDYYSNDYVDKVMSAMEKYR